MLQDHLYRITGSSKEDTQFTAHLQFHADDAIFRGHFPGNPVTPGVVQLEIIKELLQFHYSRTIELVTLASAKYLAILNPVQTPEVTVNLKIQEQEDETLKITATFAANDTIFTKAAGIYRRL